MVSETESTRSSVNIEVADDLVGILGEIQQPIGRAALELIVMEIYRRAKVSSGRGAELLGMTRLDFIRYSSDLGIPYVRVNEQELDREVQLGRSL